jgi:hypothetical protein
MMQATQPSDELKEELKDAERDYYFALFNTIDESDIGQDADGVLMLPLVFADVEEVFALQVAVALFVVRVDAGCFNRENAFCSFRFFCIEAERASELAEVSVHFAHHVADFKIHVRVRSVDVVVGSLGG